MKVRKDINGLIRVAFLMLLVISAFLMWYFSSKNEKSPVILGKNPIKMAGGFYASDIFQILLPVAISLLCSDICQEELLNNYFYVKLIRNNRLSYIKWHVSSIVKYSCICTFILIVIPQIIGIILTGSFKTYGSTDIKMVSELEIYLKKSLTVFLLTLVFGFAGSMISVIFSSKAAGFLLPFALSYLFRWLRINYLKGNYPLDSSYWFSSDLYSQTRAVSEGI